MERLLVSFLALLSLSAGAQELAPFDTAEVEGEEALAFDEVPFSLNDRLNDPGAYLAARQAYEVGDYAEAADYFGQATTSGWVSEVTWLRMLSLLNAGQLEEAAREAKRLEAQGLGNDTSFLARVFGEAAGENWTELQETVSGELYGPTATFLAPYVQAVALHALGEEAQAFALLESERVPDRLLARITLALLGVQADAPFAHADAEGELGLTDPRLAILLARHAWRHDQPNRAVDLYRLADEGENRALARIEFSLLQQGVALSELLGNRPLLSNGDHRHVLAELVGILARQAGLDSQRELATHLLLGSQALYPEHDLVPLLLAERLAQEASWREENGLSYQAFARQAGNVLKQSNLHPAQRLRGLIYEVRIRRQFLGAENALERLAETRETYGEEMVWRAEEAALLTSLDAYDDAVNLYPELIAWAEAGQNDRLWGLQLRYGHVLNELGRGAEAEAALEAAIETDPEQATSLNYLAYLWIDRGVRLDEAELMLRRALEIEPDNAAYVDSLGWLYYRQGRFERAVEVLERAVLLDAEDDDGRIHSELLDHLGDAYWQVGRAREARFMWWRALSFLQPEEEAAPIEAKLDGAEPQQLP